MIALATGLVEHSPGASIIGAKYYGYPLVWRVVMITLITSVDFWFLNLAIDVLFWTFVSSLALLFIQKVVWPKFGGGVESRNLVVPLVLLIPLGLVMDFVHEFGHAIWGIAAGGSLKYMQVAFLVVYPRFAITPLFRLGYVEVLGLSTPVSHGLFLLGGSVTTTIVAWVLAGLLWRTRLGEQTHVAIKMLGLFGLLDLPLYVVLPQIGLHHWIFIGGTVPEPLNGARAIGIPDSAFYTAVLLSTLGLTLRYYPPLQRLLHQQLRKLRTRIRNVAKRRSESRPV
jgi:hypothetical protein